MWLVGTDTPQDARDYLTKTFEEENPGSTLVIEEQQWTGLVDKLTTSLSSNDSPDIVEMGNTQAAAFTSSGALLLPLRVRQQARLAGSVSRVALSLWHPGAAFCRHTGRVATDRGTWMRFRRPLSRRAGVGPSCRCPPRSRSARAASPSPTRRSTRLPPDPAPGAASEASTVRPGRHPGHPRCIPAEIGVAADAWARGIRRRADLRGCAGRRAARAAAARRGKVRA